MNFRSLVILQTRGIDNRIPVEKLSERNPIRPSDRQASVARVDRVSGAIVCSTDSVSGVCRVRGGRGQSRAQKDEIMNGVKEHGDRVSKATKVIEVSQASRGVNTEDESY